MDAILTIDFGASWSKACSTRPYTPLPHEPQYIRAEFDRLGPSAEEKSLLANARDWEFPAYAALVDGKLQLCSADDGFDTRFPLKTMFVHRAGMSRINLEEAAELIKWVERGVITPEMVFDILVQHFCAIRAAEQRFAAARHLRHVRIGLSYPNYIRDKEEEGDFQRVESLFRDIVRVVWPHIVDVTFVTEGQGPAHYIFEPAKDNGNLFEQERLWNELGLGANAGTPVDHIIHMLIVEQGSSSTNLHLVTVERRGGRIAGMQSGVVDEWVPGVQGGSNLYNSFVRILARRRNARAPVGEIAKIMQRVEHDKYDYDYSIGSKQPISFYGTDERYSVTLLPSQRQKFMRSAFRPSIDLLKQELPKIMDLLRQPLTVVFGGGSYRSLGLKAEVGKFMEEAAVTYKANYNVDVRHIFLKDFDKSWSSAVSVGTGLCMLNLPKPEKVLTGWSVALQRQTTDDAGPRPTWDGDRNADFLLTKECKSRAEVDIQIPSTLEEQRKMRFQLICTPNTRASRLPSHRRPQTFPQITVGTYRQVYQRLKAGAYDLAWYVSATEFPLGSTYRLSLEGPDVDRLKKASADAVTDRNSLVFWADFYKVENGKEIFGKTDLRWLITVRTDPPSRYLTVTEDKMSPIFYCDGCEAEATDKVHVCTVCASFFFCDDCIGDSSVIHDDRHEFKERELG